VVAAFIMRSRYVSPAHQAQEGRQGAPLLEHRGESPDRRRPGGNAASYASGYLSLVTISHPKAGKSIPKRRPQFRTTTQLAGSSAPTEDEVIISGSRGAYAHEIS
jgi:hypothetical protein